VFLFTSGCLAAEILESTWSAKWGGSEDDYSNGVAVDARGNAYVTGTTKSFRVGSDAFLVKYSPEGEMLWEKTWGVGGHTTSKAVAVDSRGNVYITGKNFSPVGPSFEVFLVKYGPGGRILWDKTWRDCKNDEGKAVAVDARDDVYVAGYTCYHAFLVKYSPEGEMLWKEIWRGSQIDSGESVAIDHRGNVYMTGNTRYDAFLVKYNPQGEMLWEKIWEGNERERPEGIAVDARGDVYIMGRTRSFGAGGEDALLVKYNPQGEMLWEKTWGGSKDEYGHGVAVDARGNVYITGRTESFGADNWDAFLVKYSPEGKILWERTWGGSQIDSPEDVVVDILGRLYVAGWEKTSGEDADVFLISSSPSLASGAEEHQIASSETVTLIYENNLASIYRLPPKGALEGASEEVASFILQQVAQKGLTEILAKVTSALVSKLGGLFLTFITESKEVGILTRTDMVVLTGNELTNTVQSNRDFLPVIVVTAGTSFDYGVALTYERSTELFKWEIVRQVELLGFEELSALYQQGVLQYGDRFLVVPKEPFQLSTTGKYRLLAKAWSDSEGKSSYVLRVVEG